MKTLQEIAARRNIERGTHSKDHIFFKIYDRYLDAYRGKRPVILELGVFEGESTKVFAEYAADGKIIAVDMINRNVDFTESPNVSFFQCNQTDGAALGKILDEHAPDGVDVIIDDASHIGFFSQITFHHLFPRLKPEGLYIVEDWGAGYFPHHDDGAAYSPIPPISDEKSFPKRLPSHDYGMVGFVKWLVDLQGAQDIAMAGKETAFGSRPFEYMNIYHGTLVIKKALPDMSRSPSLG